MALVKAGSGSGERLVKAESGTDGGLGGTGNLEPGDEDLHTIDGLAATVCRLVQTVRALRTGVASFQKAMVAAQTAQVQQADAAAAAMQKQINRMEELRDKQADAAAMAVQKQFARIEDTLSKRAHETAVNASLAMQTDCQIQDIQAQFAIVGRRQGEVQETSEAVQALIGNVEMSLREQLAKVESKLTNFEIAVHGQLAAKVETKSLREQLVKVEMKLSNLETAPAQGSSRLRLRRSLSTLRRQCRRISRILRPQSRRRERGISTLKPSLVQ